MGKKSSATAFSMDIGISDKDRAAIAQGLSRLLADTYTLYLTTHNFHWNVTQIERQASGFSPRFERSGRVGP